jgi:ribosomal-protein-alanine N-acetyltransferase
MHEVSKAHFAPWIPDVTAEELFERSMRKVEDRAVRDTHLRLVAEHSDGRLIGLFAVGDIVRGFFECAYVSWSVSEEFKSQGYGTEGARGLLDVAFSVSHGLGLHRVQANVIPSNARSIRLAERVGFRREGLGERYLRIAGKWQDHAMYAKTVEEHVFAYLPSGLRSGDETVNSGPKSG